MTERQRLEAGAVAAWTTRFGTAPPSVSCFPNVGVFAPNGWSWRMAQAVLHDNPIPRLGGEEDFDYAEIVRHVRKAMKEAVQGA
jgi:hypothetical protein